MNEDIVAEILRAKQGKEKVSYKEIKSLADKYNLRYTDKDYAICLVDIKYTYYKTEEEMKNV